MPFFPGAQQEECEWAVTPGTWYLQTPWSLSQGSKRVTCMIQSTPGQISMDFSVPLSKSHSAFCCCVCLQAKGHLRLLPPSDCLLAPNINGLFYQLSGNSLSTHTNRKAVFLPPFAYKHLKFLSKLEIFFFFLLASYLMSTFGLYGQTQPHQPWTSKPYSEYTHKRIESRVSKRPVHQCHSSFIHSS